MSSVFKRRRERSSDDRPPVRRSIFDLLGGEVLRWHALPDSALPWVELRGGPGLPLTSGPRASARDYASADWPVAPTATLCVVVGCEAPRLRLVELTHRMCAEGAAAASRRTASGSVPLSCPPISVYASAALAPHCAASRLPLSGAASLLLSSSGRRLRRLLPAHCRVRA